MNIKYFSKNNLFFQTKSLVIWVTLFYIFASLFNVLVNARELDCPAYFFIQFIMFWWKGVNESCLYTGRKAVGKGRTVLIAISDN